MPSDFCIAAFLAVLAAREAKPLTQRLSLILAGLAGVVDGLFVIVAFTAN